MRFRIRVMTPQGKRMPADLIPRLRQLMTNIGVAFIIEEASPHTPIVEVMDSSRSEQAFILRMLQRSGYDIELGV